MKLIYEFYLTMLIPLVYAINLLLILMPSSGWVWPTGVKLTAVIAALIGLMLWGISYLSLGKSFGVLPKTRLMVTGGVYRFFSHPMYIGIMMTFAGLSIANNSHIALGFGLGITLPMLIFRAVHEEKLLIKKQK